MPERGGAGPAQPGWPPRFAVSRGDSACPNGFAADARGERDLVFQGEDALWVKLVVPTEPELPIRPTVMRESITVSR